VYGERGVWLTVALCLLRSKRSSYCEETIMLAFRSPSPHRFFFGKNNLMMVAFGREAQEEYKKGTHKICQVTP
jgi:hypothetical protein